MLGPDEAVRIAYAAEQYYREGRSRVEIAESLGVSRFKVARMLAEATSSGIVTITIATPDSVDLVLSTELRKAFGLHRVLVIACPQSDPETIRRGLAKAAGELLAEIVETGDVLGVTAGRTLGRMSRELTTLARCDVVQLAGVAGTVPEDGIEVTRRIREASGGHSRPMIAPLLLQDAATKTSLSRNPQIREVMRNFDRITKAFVAVGSWSPADSQLYESAAMMGEAQRLLDLGVQTEVCGSLIREDGSILDGYEDRMLAISTEQLRRVPEVVAVAGGATKSRSILSALRSGLVTSLVTDSEVARELLELARPEDARSRRGEAAGAV